MYSASAKGCNKLGCRVQTIVNSHYQDFPFQEDAIISRLVQNVYQWISRHLEVATSPYPRGSRMKQDGYPRSAHPPHSPTPTYSPPQPPHSPTQDQWSSQPVDPSDKAEGKGRWPTARRRGEEGGQHQSRRRGSPEKDLIGSRREDSC